MIYHFERLGFAVATADHKTFQVFQRHASSAQSPRYAHRLNPHASTPNLEEANLVCRVEAGVGGYPRIEYRSAAAVQPQWLVNFGAVLSEIDRISKCPLPSGDVVSTASAKFGHCRDCAQWMRGPDMTGPSGAVAGGKRISYGMCGSSRSGLGGMTTELDDNGAPIPMVYTVSVREARTREAPDHPWPTRSTPSLNTREDFGCPDFRSRSEPRGEPRGTEAIAELSFKAKIPVGETRDIETVAEEAAAFTTLVVDTSNGFEIMSLTIDGKKQLDTAVGIPGSCFTAPLRFKLDPVVLGSRVVLRVRNIGAGWPFEARLQSLLKSDA